MVSMATHNAIQEWGCAYKITHILVTTCPSLKHGVKLKLRQWPFIHCRLCKLSSLFNLHNYL